MKSVSLFLFLDASLMGRSGIKLLYNDESGISLRMDVELLDAAFCC